jgi:hypothetical protein
MRFGSMLRLAAAVLAAGSLGVAAAASSSPASGPQGGQGSTLVMVDFRALTPDGAPVLDLNVDDLTLKVGGRVRPIVAFEVMRADSRAVGQPTADAPVPPYLTNAGQGSGRDVVLLVDLEGIPTGKEPAVKTALSELVAALSPADRISLLASGGGAERVGPTTAHQRVLDAIGLLTGRALRGETDAELACRSRINLLALVDVLRSSPPAVSTVVVFVTNGFTSPTGIEEIGRGQGPDSACELMPRDFEGLAAARDMSHAQLFAIQTLDDGLPTDATASEMSKAAARSSSTGGMRASPVATPADMSAGLEHIAGLTGNGIIRLIGDSGPAMQRIARETSAYYLAAFEAEASERTGGSERVEISVSRPGVEVRAHPRLVIAKLVAPGGKKAPAPKPRDMLSVTRIFTDLPLRATFFTTRASSDGKLRAVALFESSDASVRITAASAALFDARNEPRAQWTGQDADLSRSPILAALVVPKPGTYRFRVAAADAAGAGGTIDGEVTLEPAVKDAIWASSLVLGVPSGQTFAPRLQFTDEAEAVAMVELAGLGKTAAVSATFELAGSESGPALATLPGTIRASSDGTKVAFVGIPIGPMPPGNVVVRAVITVDGKPLAVKPARTLLKTTR